MTRARKYQIPLSDTSYYHLISRCVRRAFLCGETKKQPFEHRRSWSVDRIKQLSTIYSIDICSYAVMSNHALPAHKHVFFPCQKTNKLLLHMLAFSG